MFHVKPFSSAPLTPTRAAVFHVKHFCVNRLDFFLPTIDRIRAAAAHDGL